jgi:superfamily II DNA or RNA helicase
MKTVISVVKKDETQVQVVCNDTGALMEVSEFFTFMAEGYKFMPSYKNKMWDGKVRLFNLRNNTLPFGLLNHLAEFARTRDYDLSIHSSISSRVVPASSDLKEYVESIALSSRGQKIELRDYQYDGFQQSIRNGRSLLISPTGSGKSLIIYLLLRWYLDHHDDDKMVLIVVPTTSLVSQMKKDFIDYSQFDENFDGASEVHEIYAGQEKHNFASRVVVTTWQSAVKLNPAWFSSYGMVIGDEAHTFKAKSLNTIMSMLVGAEYRIGTTGTIDNLQVNKLVLIGNFGPVHRVVSTKTLMDSDTLAKLKIKCLVLKYEDEIRKVVCKADYPDEMNYIVGHAGRNNFIANLALDQKGNTLVLFNFVGKHGKPLDKLIRSKSKDATRKIFYVSGGVDALERERIREITEKETNAIIVASMGVFSVGINIRNLSNIIFASPTKSQIRVLQSIGRGLRKSDNGQATTVYDISDDLSWKKKKNYTLNHAVARVKIYDSEQFDYKIYEIPMK